MAYQWTVSAEEACLLGIGLHCATSFEAAIMRGVVIYALHHGKSPICGSHPLNDGLSLAFPL